MSQPTFETNRLTLRPMRAEDRDAVIKIFADPESSRYLTRDMSDQVNAATSFERWLGWGAPGGMGSWILDLNGTVIGVGRFTPSDRLPGKVVEVGWFVARSHAGQGYASEALRTLLDYGIRTLGLPAIWALIHVDNEPSYRLAAGLGFLNVADFYQPAGPGRIHVLLPPGGSTLPEQPTLRTERLVIRPLREDDRRDVRDIFSDPAITRLLSKNANEPGWIDETVDRRLGYDGPAGMGHWAFVEDDILVGVGHLRPSWELPGGVPEIGWFLGTAHQGRGLATEAAAALRDHGLYTLRLPAVWALVHRDNTASTRLSERLGFVEVGTGQHYGDSHRVCVALPRAASR
ncbi:RimJ/RimL family protein N-acetyltransferase [Kibdelosporangium banguiense]|uniref:RimJ/RimL family protein N-acetyltransferase n=1 Tax=Kibdelosporangium banguiense TaxID=1365924 RepID=A0ABS4U0J9_9PSEU|nr:GNAT family N-acetyltransferase [Kibdelosporangium banguiense]MBP2330172.1 RimJ/RimL family protein N-acetyltransferase [Kibdelosporangium banguiense]